MARAARARGLPVYVETRPIYLHLTAERFDGAGRRRCTSASRRCASTRPGRALERACAAGDVHTCCTDHAPGRCEQKLDPSLTIANLRRAWPTSRR